MIRFIIRNQDPPFESMTVEDSIMQRFLPYAKLTFNIKLNLRKICVKNENWEMAHMENFWIELTKNITVRESMPKSKSLFNYYNS